jgi:rod shape-determining protein MreD
MTNLVPRQRRNSHFMRPATEKGTALRTMMTLGVILVAALLQTSATPFFPIFGIRVDLVLIFLAVWANVSRESRILVWAFSAGLILDLASGTPSGTNTLALTAGAYVAALGRSGLFRTNVPWSLAAVAVSTLIYYPITMILLQSHGFSVSWGRTLSTTIPLATIVNVLATLVLYWPITLLERFTRGKRPYRIL